MRAALVLLLLLSSCGGAQWPSDDAVKTAFDRDRTSFEEIAKMSEADASIWRIAYDRAMKFDAPRTPPRNVTPQELPAERLARYRTLFRKVGLPSGLTREKQENGVALLLPVFTAQSGAVDSVEKGVLYTTATVTDIVTDLSLDAIRKNKPNTLHKRLDGNWYMYARYNE